MLVKCVQVSCRILVAALVGGLQSAGKEPVSALVGGVGSSCRRSVSSFRDNARRVRAVRLVDRSWFSVGIKSSTTPVDGLYIFSAGLTCIGGSGWCVVVGLVELFRVCEDKDDAFWSMNGEQFTLVITDRHTSAYGRTDRLVDAILPE